MKVLYCSSVSYPSPYANRLQVLNTAQALGKKLGESFVLGAYNVSVNTLYTHRVVNFGIRRGPLLAFKYLLFIRKERITQLYTREHVLFFYIMILNALLFRRKLVYIYEGHDVDPLSSFRFGFVLRRCAYLFSTNAFVLEELRKKNPSIPGSVLPNGVDLSTFDISASKLEARKEVDLPPEGKILVYTGRFKTFGNEKGITLVMQALKHFSRSDILFVAVGGSEEDVRFYEEEGKRLGVMDKVLLRGSTTQSNLALYQRAADCLMMYFPRAFHYDKYMSPIKMFEYMASNTPIVASDLPSIREVLSEQNAYIVAPDNPRLLFEALESIVNNPEEGHARARMARRDVEKYSWDARAERIISAIA